MAAEEAVVETIEYCVVFVEPDSHKVLAVGANGVCSLPRVRIPHQTRPAEQLRKVSKAAWGLEVIVLDFFLSQGPFPGCAVAELLSQNASADFQPVAPETISRNDLSDQQRASLADVLSGEAKSPLARVGWIDEAVAWLESATQRKLPSKSGIDQLNAGGGFSLVRFHMEGGGHYWLKATGEPNAHELPITCALSGLCRGYLPEVISTRPSWNAWLMPETATQLAELSTDPFKLFLLLEDVVESMAHLQMKTAGHARDLLDAGAFNHCMRTFLRHSESLFDYLEEAMALQTSTKVPRLETARLREIRAIFESVCHRVEELGLPETIVHGDLNQGNILIGPGHCQFIDWCEAYLGNPLITLQRILLLNKLENLRLRDPINRALKQCYLDVWTKAFDPARFEAGFVFMPLLAVVSSLCGRGDWLTSHKRHDPQHRSYARSLARHMDRAAREPELLESLCH